MIHSRQNNSLYSKIVLAVWPIVTIDKSAIPLKVSGEVRVPINRGLDKPIYVLIL